MGKFSSLTNICSQPLACVQLAMVLGILYSANIRNIRLSLEQNLYISTNSVDCVSHTGYATALCHSEWSLGELRL